MAKILMHIPYGLSWTESEKLWQHRVIIAKFTDGIYVYRYVGKRDDSGHDKPELLKIFPRKKILKAIKYARRQIRKMKQDQILLNFYNLD